MLIALILAASCTQGAPEGKHSDVITVKPKKATGCWAQLEALSKKGWDKARAQVADADVQPCLGEARNALEKFKDEAAFREWLKTNGLAEGLPANVHPVSLRHALYLSGHIVDVALEQSASPPLRPVDGMGVIAALAPELKGAKFLDTRPPLAGCNLLTKGECNEDCYPLVKLLVSTKDACFSLDVKALNCVSDMMAPYVFEEVRLLNQALGDAQKKFVLIDKGAAVTFGPKAGLDAAIRAELLSTADESGTAGD